MSLSQRWAEWKGLTWPSSSDVQDGAARAAVRAMRAAYPTFRDIGEGLSDQGVAYITSLSLNWNSGEGGEAFVQGWNDYVREYRACKQNYSSPGQFNYKTQSLPQHRSCLEHAKRFVNWKYIPTMVKNNQRNHPRRGWNDPREETWGYQPPQASNQLFGSGLRVVTAASAKGSGPVARSLRRDVAQGLAAVRGNLPTPTNGAITPLPEQVDPPPTPQPEAVVPYTIESNAIGRFWWLLLPVGFVLLSRRS